MAVVRVCRTDELASGEIVLAPTAEKIAVMNADGEFFAIADTCTHAKMSLTEAGEITGKTIECLAHFARYSLETGEVLQGPALVAIKTYPVHVRDDEIFVEV